MNSTPEAIDPAQAEAALATARRQQRAAIMHTYNTPRWFFYCLGAALLIFSAVYLLDSWIEAQFGFAASIIAYFVGLLFFFGCLFTLLLAVSKKQRTQPVEPFKALGSRRTIVLAALGVFAVFALLWVAGYLLLGSMQHAGATVLGLVAVTIAVGGKPFQRLIRDRVLRQHGLDGASR